MFGTHQGCWLPQLRVQAAMMPTQADFGCDFFSFSFCDRDKRMAVCTSCDGHERGVCRPGSLHIPLAARHHVAAGSRPLDLARFDLSTGSLGKSGHLELLWVSVAASALSGPAPA